MTGATTRPEVLIADDRPENILALESILQDLDLACATARSGQEVLNLVLDHEFAVILLDVQMPEMDGFETARLLNGMQRTRNIPIVFVTAINKDPRHVLAGYEVGAVDYICKPIDTSILLGKVKVFVDLFRQKNLIRTQSLELENTIRELEDARSVLLAANEELDQFNHVACHDLQEPLRTLRVYADRLLRISAEELSEETRISLGFIVDAAARMQAQVQALLALSRHSRCPLARRDVALDECVDGALAGLGARITETSAVIRRETLPTVCADAALVTALYSNLIGNALKFVSAGVRPELDLTCTHKDGTNVLGIRDNGIGIDPDCSKVIFAPFRRLHGPDEYPGSGIGLAICRKIVERHGGRIWVESHPGDGAHFRFTLGPSSEPASPAATE